MRQVETAHAAVHDGYATGQRRDYLILSTQIVKEHQAGSFMDLPFYYITSSPKLPTLSQLRKRPFFLHCKNMPVMMPKTTRKPIKKNKPSLLLLY
ncbi:MAG: hypothetical protein GY699_07435 [Desulfobacteraceae bacterium]|nr:hypothetical protein [Desulfobacteraceae bacterium]